ncbi:MAG TPA: M6 family metalloprotease domain-containing protein [Symbiobacteriaceae bacterium]|nr:M6 family metalloprotease domain-containing protein [Symbiobacteriaceae bacterium]
MKRSKLLLILAVIAIMVLGAAAPGAAGTTRNQFKMRLPSFAKVDRDFAMDSAAAGIKVTGKELRGYNPGQSYLSPGNGTSVGRIDARGSVKGLAILVDWPVSSAEMSDVPGVDYEQVPADLFDDLFNGTEYDPYARPMWSHLATYPDGQPASTRGTLRNYYDEISYGQFSIDVDVVGWVTLPHGYDYYMGQNKGHYNDNGDAYIGELVEDAVLAAKEQFDINLADWAIPARPGDFADLAGNATSIVQDGQTIDKVVPNLFIIHRGTGAEYSRDPSIIWSHAWSIVSARYWGEYYRTNVPPDESALRWTVVDGVVVNQYNTCPEVGQNITGFGIDAPRAPSPAYVGVYAHEFGHVLGLPDLYDYGYDSEGVGDVSLMAGGSYGREYPDRYYSGNSPSHVEGWGKQYLSFLNFKDIMPTATPVTKTLRPANESKDVYRIKVPNGLSYEYFVMENRQQQGFDRGLSYFGDPALHGLVVYQVDESVFARTFWRANEANNPHWTKRSSSAKTGGETHYAMAVLQADGQYQLEVGGYTDAADFFPGSLGVTSLLPAPVNGLANTASWYQLAPGRSTTGIKLSDITENDDGSVTVTITYEP